MKNCQKIHPQELIVKLSYSTLELRINRVSKYSILSLLWDNDNASHEFYV